MGHHPMLPNQKILFYFMIVKNVSMIESKKIVKMCKQHNFVKSLTGKMTKNTMDWAHCIKLNVSLCYCLTLSFILLCLGGNFFEECPIILSLCKFTEFILTKSEKNEI